VGPLAGFQESSPIAVTVDVIEYRNGNDRQNAVRKITGLNKATDVTLKRGVIGALDLYAWFDQIRNGDQNAYRTVVIQLLNEERAVVLAWKLHRARIARYSIGPLNARGSDVAIEELTLAYERLEME
jgi:phage tail-like protein